MYDLAKLDGWIFREEKKERIWSTMLCEKRQKHPHTQLSLNLKWPSSFKAGNNHNLNLLVPSKALDTHKKHSHASQHKHMLVEGQLAQGENDGLFWSSVSMTTFNWMVNQLLICLSTAWCGENEMEKERERNGGERKREWDGGEKGDWEDSERSKRETNEKRETETKRGKTGTCMCVQ